MACRDNLPGTFSDKEVAANGSASAQPAAASGGQRPRRLRHRHWIARRQRPAAGAGPAAIHPLRETALAPAMAVCLAARRCPAAGERERKDAGARPLDRSRRPIRAANSADHLRRNAENGYYQTVSWNAVWIAEPSHPPSKKRSPQPHAFFFAPIQARPKLPTKLRPRPRKGRRCWKAPKSSALRRFYPSSARRPGIP